MRPWVATLALIAVTVVWGATFVVVRSAIAVYGVLPFLAVRFVIAAVVAALLWGKLVRRDTLVVGGRIGLVLALGYLFQTWGLKHTTATNAGLITGLFVVFGPLADRALYGTHLPRRAWISVALSLVGLALLVGRAPADLAIGDLLTLVCALAFGLQIALLARHAREHDARGLGAAQMFSSGAVFLLIWPLAGEIVMPPREVWFALVLTGVAASALAYAIQTAAQRHLSSARTAVILTLEPVFAGIFGYALAGDRLGPVQLLGAGLILGAVTVSEIVPALRSRQP